MSVFEKAQLPFGPGNSQLTNMIVKKVGAKGTFLDVQPMFTPAKAGDPAPPPGPSAASIRLAADEKKRAARLSETVPTSQKGTTLLSAKSGSRLGS